MKHAGCPAADQGTLSDEELVERAAGADVEAVAQLYDRFGAAAYRLALAVLGDRALAEDVVASSFGALREGAWAVLSQQAGSARGRFLVLVHRRAVTQARRGRHPSRGSRTAASAHRAVSHGVSDLLAQLSAAEREVLALSYFEGRNRSEVAEIMGTTSDTIGRLMASGLTGLRQPGGEPAAAAPSDAKIVAPTRTRVAPSSAATR